MIAITPSPPWSPSRTRHRDKQKSKPVICRTHAPLSSRGETPVLGLAGSSDARSGDCREREKFDGVDLDLAGPTRYRPP